MILDRGHKRWAMASGLVLGGSLALYLPYARAAPDGATGGSAWGLAFGIAAAAFVLFAALLGLRKRRPHYRLGRASTWLKGHLWLGFLSMPLALFHGGFRFGGPLTQVLMWTFVAVFVTGLWGLALQQVLPRLMTKNVPQETVYEQIDHVRTLLLEEAVEMARGTATRSGAVAKAKEGGAIQGRVVSSRATVEREENASQERVPLVRFVEDFMRPFFQREGAVGSPLSDAHRRAALFGELRQKIEPKLHPVAHDLEALCSQRAQLEVQRRLHHWLHGWLLIHVPLSYAMVFLTAVHAVTALYY